MREQDLVYLERSASSHARFIRVKDERHHSVTVDIKARTWTVCVGNQKETSVIGCSIEDPDNPFPIIGVYDRTRVDHLDSMAKALQLITMPSQAEFSG